MLDLAHHWIPIATCYLGAGAVLYVINFQD